MERSLRFLFDYQKFEQSSSLQTVIDDVIDRYSLCGLISIEDDSLDMVAGGVGEGQEETKDDGQGTV